MGRGDLISCSWVEHDVTGNSSQCSNNFKLISVRKFLFKLQTQYPLCLWQCLQSPLWSVCVCLCEMCSHVGFVAQILNVYLYPNRNWCHKVKVHWSRQKWISNYNYNTDLGVNNFFFQIFLRPDSWYWGNVFWYSAKVQNIYNISQKWHAMMIRKILCWHFYCSSF